MTGRFPPIPPDQLTPDQARMVEGIAAGPRQGSLRGPFNALLRSPTLGDHVQRVGAYIRYHSAIPAPLNEMAILMAGRHCNAQYEFYAHTQLALAAGLPAHIPPALAQAHRPDPMDPDQTLVWEACHELLTTTHLSDPTFAATTARFGEQGLVDLVAALGYYTLVSYILNIARVPLPDGEPAPLPMLPGDPLKTGLEGDRPNG